MSKYQGLGLRYGAMQRSEGFRLNNQGFRFNARVIVQESKKWGRVKVKIQCQGQCKGQGSRFNAWIKVQDSMDGSRFKFFFIKCQGHSKCQGLRCNGRVKV